MASWPGPGFLYQPLHWEIGGLLDRQRQDDKRIDVTIPPVVLMRAEKMIK